MTDDMEVIEAVAMRYSDTGKRIFVERLNGEFLNLDVKEVVSVRKIAEDWEYFEWSDGALTDYIVVEKGLDSLSKQELFDLTMNWIKETFKNPDEVIQTTIDNSKIRFRGSDSFIKCKYFGGDFYTQNGYFTVSISFKDGKYKFDPIEVETTDLTAYKTKLTLSLDNTNWRLKPWGKNNPYSTRKYWAVSIEDQFNLLNLSLFSYLIVEKHDVSADDDW